MIAIQITSMKSFMGKLLASDVFDCFLLEEAVISTANTFTIDGHINQEFFAGQEPKGEKGGESAARQDAIPGTEFRPWSEIKGLCFDLIKGRRTPLFFRFVMHLMPERARELLTREDCDIDPSQIKALVLNIRYDGSNAVLTTGISFHTFVLSKEPDVLWDNALIRYLDQKGIAFERL